MRMSAFPSNRIPRNRGPWSAAIAPAAGEPRRLPERGGAVFALSERLACFLPDLLVTDAEVIDAATTPEEQRPAFFFDVASVHVAIYDAVVAAGLVVDGGIYRHEFVATAVLNGLMQVQLETGVPVLSVVLTPQQFHEHTTHHEFFAQHLALKGQEAAQTCAGIVLQAAELATFLAGRSGV